VILANPFDSFESRPNSSLADALDHPAVGGRWDRSLMIPIEGERPNMRSDRVFDALHTLRNRYMLCQLASKATRKFHKPNTRIQETMNQVFDKIADAERHDILSEPENFAEAQRRAA
jgi:hypothetical protein